MDHSEAGLELQIKKLNNLIKSRISSMQFQDIPKFFPNIPKVPTISEFREIRDNFLEMFNNPSEIPNPTSWTEETLNRVKEDFDIGTDPKKSLKLFLVNEVNRVKRLRDIVLERCNNPQCFYKTHKSFLLYMDSISKYIYKCEEALNRIDSGNLNSFIVDDLFLEINSSFTQRHRQDLLEEIKHVLLLFPLQARQQIFTDSFMKIENILKEDNKNGKIPTLPRDIESTNNQLIKLAHTFQINCEIDANDGQRFLYYSNKVLNEMWSKLTIGDIPIKHYNFIQPELSPSIQEIIQSSLIEGISANINLKETFSSIFSTTFEQLTQIVQEQVTQYNILVGNQIRGMKFGYQLQRTLIPDHKIQSLMELRFVQLKFLATAVLSHLNYFESVKFKLQHLKDLNPQQTKDTKEQNISVSNDNERKPIITLNSIIKAEKDSKESDDVLNPLLSPQKPKKHQEEIIIPDITFDTLKCSTSKSFCEVLEISDDEGSFLFDSAIEEYHKLEEQLISIGSFYVNTFEESSSEMPANESVIVDYQSIVESLLFNELKFLNAKRHLVEPLLEILQHDKDQKLILQIYQIMKLRPSLNLPIYKYFDAPYKVAIELMETRATTIRTLVNTQIMNERQIGMQLNNKVPLFDRPVTLFCKPPNYTINPSTKEDSSRSEVEDDTTDNPNKIKENDRVNNEQEEGKSLMKDDNQILSQTQNETLLVPAEKISENPENEDLPPESDENEQTIPLMSSQYNSTTSVFNLDTKPKPDKKPQWNEESSNFSEENQNLFVQPYRDGIPISPFEVYESLGLIADLIKLISNVVMSLSESINLKGMKFSDYIELGVWKALNDFCSEFFKKSSFPSDRSTYRFNFPLKDSVMSLFISPFINKVETLEALIADMDDSRKLRFMMSMRRFLSLTWILQSEIIETNALQSAYFQQATDLGMTDRAVNMISFKEIAKKDVFEAQLISGDTNFLDFAINEFEKSSLDFSSEICVKDIIFASDFSPLKRVITFQKLQNAILQIAVRYNSFFLDSHFLVSYFELGDLTQNAQNLSLKTFVTGMNNSDDKFIKQYIASRLFYNSTTIYRDFVLAAEDKSKFYLCIKNVKSRSRTILSAQVKQKELNSFDLFKLYTSEVLDAFSPFAYRIEIARVSMLERNILLTNSFVDTYTLGPEPGTTLINDSGGFNRFFYIPTWVEIFEMLHSAPHARQTMVLKSTLQFIQSRFRILCYVRYECSLVIRTPLVFDSLYNQTYQCENAVLQQLQQELNALPNSSEVEIAAKFIGEREEFYFHRLEYTVLDTFEQYFIGLSTGQQPRTLFGEKAKHLWLEMHQPFDIHPRLITITRYMPLWAERFICECDDTERIEFVMRLKSTDIYIETALAPLRPKNSNQLDLNHQAKVKEYNDRNFAVKEKQIENIKAKIELQLLPYAIDFLSLIISQIHIKFAYFLLLDGVSDDQINIKTTISKMNERIYNLGAQKWNDIIIKEANIHLVPKDEAPSKIMVTIPEPKISQALFDVVRTHIDVMLLSNQSAQIEKFILSFQTDSDRKINQKSTYAEGTISLKDITNKINQPSLEKNVHNTMDTFKPDLTSSLEGFSNDQQSLNTTMKPQYNFQVLKRKENTSLPNFMKSEIPVSKKIKKRLISPKEANEQLFDEIHICTDFIAKKLISDFCTCSFHSEVSSENSKDYANEHTGEKLNSTSNNSSFTDSHIDVSKGEWVINPSELQKMAIEMSNFLESFASKSLDNQVGTWQNYYSRSILNMKQIEENDKIINSLDAFTNQRFRCHADSKIEAFFHNQFIQLNTLHQKIEAIKQDHQKQEENMRIEIKTEFNKLINDLKHQISILKDEHRGVKRNVSDRVLSKINSAKSIIASMRPATSSETSFETISKIDLESNEKNDKSILCGPRLDKSFLETVKEDNEAMRKTIVKLRCISVMTKVAVRREYIKELEISAKERKAENESLYRENLLFEKSSKVSEEKLYGKHMCLSETYIEIERLKTELDNQRMSNLQLVHWKAKNLKTIDALEEQLAEFKGTDDIDIDQLLKDLEEDLEEVNALRSDNEERVAETMEHIVKPMKKVQKTREETIQTKLTQAKLIETSMAQTQMVTKQRNKECFYQQLSEANIELKQQNEELEKKIEELEQQKNSKSQRAQYLMNETLEKRSKSSMRKPGKIIRPAVQRTISRI